MLACTQRNKVRLCSCRHSCRNASCLTCCQCFVNRAVKQRMLLCKHNSCQASRERVSRWHRRGARWVLSHASSRVTRALARYPELAVFCHIVSLSGCSQRAAESNQTWQTPACQVSHITALCHFQRGIFGDPELCLCLLTAVQRLSRSQSGICEARARRGE